MSTFGFRREDSITLQIDLEVAQQSDATNRHLSTAAVLLDVNKAFSRS